MTDDDNDDDDDDDDGDDEVSTRLPLPPVKNKELSVLLDSGILPWVVLEQPGK